MQVVVWWRCKDMMLRVGLDSERQLHSTFLFDRFNFSIVLTVVSFFSEHSVSFTCTCYFLDNRCCCEPYFIYKLCHILQLRL